MPDLLTGTFTFPVSGVTVNPLWPFLAGLSVSCFTSMGGVSGAFLLLPFQVSVLGFTSPSVSSTNLVFNILATPGGILGFVRERRMNWSLVWVIAAATMPGVFVGAWIRLRFLPDPGAFKVFVGLVLLYVGGRLLADLVSWLRRRRKGKKEAGPQGDGSRPAGPVGEGEIRTIGFSATRASYTWQGNTYSYNPLMVTLLVTVVGVVGGAYGIGGGAIVAPFLVSVFGLPVHTIAGATLAGSFISSVVGVAFYTVLALAIGGTGAAGAPDWMLGALFGAGGVIGVYAGARMQKHVHAIAIKAMLSAIMIYLAARYILQIFV